MARAGGVSAGLGPGGVCSDTARNPAFRTVNPSAYAYPGSNPGSATEVRGYVVPQQPF